MHVLEAILISLRIVIDVGIISLSVTSGIFIYKFIKHDRELKKRRMQH